MSLASGEDKKNGGKKSWLPLSWGARFTIAVLGTVIIWWQNLQWMRSSNGCTHCTSWDVIWILIQAAIFPLLGLFFLAWTVKLLWKQRFFLVQWLCLTNKQQGLFTAIFFAGAALEVGFYYATRALAPFRAMHLYLVSSYVFYVIWICSFCWVSRNNSRITSQSGSIKMDENNVSRTGLKRWWNARENRFNAISFFIMLIAFISPGPLIKNLVWYSALVILCQMYIRLYGWSLWLAIHGYYKCALWLNRYFVWIQGFGPSFRGWIQLEGGQYQDAKATFKQIAFDESGQPRLESMNLYFYATSLALEGDVKQAQNLLEPAAQAQERISYFHIKIADVLLEQGKEPERALEISKQALDSYNVQDLSKQQSMERVNTIGFCAYALAACKRDEEAKARLQEAFDASAIFDKRGLAGFQILAGKTYMALGDQEKAALSFQSALKLHPFGDIALRARKNLAKLSESVGA
jgi:tetratricopeptide (TPR) repeat protein